MKIETSIKPRRDGTVRVNAPDEVVVFSHDENGVMVAEVENDQTIAFLLSRADDFIPADDADFEVANSLLSQGIDGDDDPSDPDDDEEPVDMNAAPIEEPASVVAAPAPAKAATPRKPRKPRNAQG